MKIYLAATYSRLEEMQEYGRQLEGLGHEITSQWIKGHQVDDEMFYVDYCYEDINDLANAQTLILFSDNFQPSTSRGGRHVEFGLALAYDQRIILVGQRENIFQYHDTVEQYDTWDGAYSMLKQEANLHG